MPQVRVDGEAFAGGETAGTYSDVLDLVDPVVAGRSRIVTAFRVNGVEEPAFREPAARSRTLDAADLVELETTSALQLATDALEDTVRLTPSLCAAATQISLRLRTADAAAAGQELAPLAEGLTLLVTLVQAAEAWADAAHLERVSWVGTDVVAIARCIEALETAQRDEDWVSIADVLGYDLVPALEAWRARLAAVVVTLPSPGTGAHATEA